MSKVRLTYGQEQILKTRGGSETLAELQRLTNLSQYVIGEKLRQFGLTPLTKQQALEMGKIQKLPKHSNLDNDYVKETKQPMKRPPAVYTNTRYLYPEIAAIQ